MFNNNQRNYYETAVNNQLDYNSQPNSQPFGIINVTLINPITPEEYVGKKLGFIAYKSVGDYIITLGIPYLAKTNMARPDVVDKNYAQFRTNCVDVLKIQLKNYSNESNENFTLVNSVESDYKPIFIYNLNTRILCEFDDDDDDDDDDDKDNDNIEEDDYDDVDDNCETGIDFFLSFEAAYFYNFSIFNIPSLGPFILKGWYENGVKAEEYNYLNGIFYGIKTWHINGSKREEYNYLNGVKHGFHQEWDVAGNLVKKENYNNGVKL